MSLPTEKTSKYLTGWRGFHLAYPNLLLSQSTVWMPHEWTESFCGLWPVRTPEHEPPVETCTCGIYSFKRASTIGERHYGRQDVFAEIELRGKVVEHTHGYRAQFARIKKLYFEAGTQIQQELEFTAFKYEVPFELYDKDEPVWGYKRLVITPPNAPQVVTREMRRAMQDQWNILLAQAIADELKRRGAEGKVVLPPAKNSSEQ